MQLKKHPLHYNFSFERRFPSIRSQWRRQDFVTGRGSEVWVYGRSIEYEDPQSRLYCLCINVALCSTALQCICPVIRRSSMTMKAHILHNFWTSTHRGGASSPSPLAAPLSEAIPPSRCRTYSVVLPFYYRFAHVH